MVLASIVYGAGVGIAYSLKGWMSKAKKTEKEGKNFDIKKLVVTAIIGAVIGGIATQFGMSFESASTTLQGLGLITAIEGGALAFVNTVWKKIQNL